MNQQDLLRTVQLQQAQINVLKDQLANYQGNNYQIKYKKALKEISGIIKANRQLKDELVRLSHYKSSQNESFNQINKEEIGKAYEKVLKDKSLILGQKQILQLENEKMRYSLASLEQTIARLKSEKMALARQNEGVSKLSLLQRSSDDNSKQKLRDREAQYRRTLENYEERDANLARNNRKLEEQIMDMENEIFKVSEDFKTKLNQKDIQLRVSKSSARQQFQSQISQMKKQITQLKVANSQLNMRLQSYAEEQRNFGEGRNQYEEQLIETLRELRSQIEPMSIQIHELQNQNEFQKEQSQREKANLLIKVMEDEREIQRLRETYKILQIKLLKEIEKCRKFEESETMIRRLEEQNRMLGGKVIVLESKEVALRNRSGDELEERVVQFQTRVEMLLNEKQEISNIKTVPIQQLIALKAYVFELDSKLKQVVKQNEYAVSKYKSYKEKTTALVRQLKQHEIATNGLKSKLQGYDRLVIKFQGELERAININDNEFKIVNMKINESSMVGQTNADAYKKRYESLVEKLSLQQKYSEQEIQTLRLNYDTKLIDLNIKLGELDSVKETIGLYKIKNQELSHKLTQKENQLLESKIGSGGRTTITTVSNSVNLGGTGFNFQVANLEIELADVKQRYEMEVNKVKKLKESSEQQRSRIDSLQASLSKVKSELRDMEQRHKTQLLQIETRPISKPVTLDFDLRSLQMEYNQLQIRYERVEKDSQRYASLTRQYENQISVLNQNIANINISLQRQRQSNGKTTQNQYERQSQIEQLQYQYRLLTSKFNDIQEAINQKEQQIGKNRIQFNKDKYRLETQLQNKEEDVNRLNRDINKIKNQLTLKFQHDNQQKEFIIARLTNEINSLKNQHTLLKDRQVQWEYQANNKHNEQSKVLNEFNFVRNRADELEHELQLVRAELNRVRFQANNAETSLSSQFEQIQSKQSALLRCQNELRIKNQEVSELQQQLQEKKAQINRINYQLNEMRGKYSQLEEERDRKDGDWSGLNRQLVQIRANLQGYQYDSNMKDAALERSKNEIKQLKREIDGLHEEIFEKNKELTSVNQQLFRVRLDNEQSQNDNIHRLENEIYSLKSRVNSLQSQLSEKQDEINRAYLQINSARSIPANKYSDDQYEIISVQFNQTQRSLTEARSLLSQKEYEINELTNKIEYLKRNQVQSKNKFNQERNDFENQLQNVLNRERALRNQLINLQTEPQNSHSHDQNSQHGLHMYQQECDRLTKITEELQQEVSALKLKLTYMTNQEDRIVENLTVMTLTFVEVEALRERIKNKENQISDVRKSLIQYASSEQINTVSSRLQSLAKIQNKQELRSQTNVGSYEQQNTSAGPYISHHNRINNAPQYQSINSSFRQSGHDNQGYNYELYSGIGHDRQKERQEQKQIQADRRLRQLTSSITEHEDVQRNNHLNLGSSHQVNTSHQGITYAMRQNKVVSHQQQNATLQQNLNVHVQPSQQQNSLGGSWRYGAQSNTNINSQVQVNPSGQAKILYPSINNSSQHQVKINFGSNNSIGSNKIISPQQLLQQHHHGFVQDGFAIQGGHPTIVGQNQFAGVANYPAFNR